MKRTLLLLSTLATILWQARADESHTVEGCPCQSACSRTLDYPDVPWCYTSPVPTDLTDNASLANCGRYYSQKKHAYWDACVVNTTNVGQHTQTLDTLSGMWATMTVATTASCAAAYCIAGCIASGLISTKRTLLWLPGTALVLGACHGFGIGAVFAVIVSFMFLSIPYAVDFTTIVALGCGLAVLIVYSGLGRHYDRFVAPHTAEYTD